MAYWYKPGDVIDGHRLQSKLGTGGNSEVWLTDHDGKPAAIKLLHSHDPASNVYRRFQDEVAIMQELDGHPGVLPYLDAAVPDRPSKASPAWLVTPKATAISEALRDANFTDVVSAIQQIASTLSDLAAKNIAHRDVKPGNLFLFDGRFVVGDFGLVEFPGKQDVSANADKVGPVHFIAPEMLRQPLPVDCRPADVYSLAKTLWVLATGQTYPPPGNQPVRMPAVNLSGYVADKRAALVDALVDRCTRLDPEQRPRMADFNQELVAWLSGPPTAVEPVGLDALTKQVLEALEPGRREVEQLEIYQQQAEAQTPVVRESLTRIADEIASAGMSSTAHQGGLTPDYWRGGRRPRYPNWSFVFNVKSEPYPKGPTLWSTISMELHGQQLYVIAAHTISAPDPINGSRDEEVWSDRATAVVGGPEHEQAVARLVQGLTETMGVALKALADWP